MTASPDRPFYGSYWVVPGRLLAGPYPRAWSGDITRDRLQRLLDLGVNCFVDLTQTGEQDPYAPLLPAHVEHRSLPIPDMDVPTFAQMRRILDTIDAALDGGRTVYVHCWGGIGRTGTVVGCYLVRHGLTGEVALQEIARLRGVGSPETDAQRQMILDWREKE